MLINNYNFPKMTWEEHWTNGGTGITKLNKNDAELFKPIVEAWNKISSKKMRVDAVTGALHTEDNSTCDLSDFWEFQRRFETKDTL